MKLASGIRACTCGAGCPVVEMVDEAGKVVAQAHLLPDLVEEFIAQLRKAAELGQARRRPAS